MYYHYFSENFFIDFELNTAIEFKENKLLLNNQDFKLIIKSAQLFEINGWNFFYNPVIINHQESFLLYGKKDKKIIYAVSICKIATHYDEIMQEFDLQFPHFNLNEQFIKPDFKYILIENDTHFVLKIDKNEKFWSQGEMTFRLKIQDKLKKQIVPLDNNLIDKIKLYINNIPE